MNSLSNNNIYNANAQPSSTQPASVQSSQYVTLPDILKQPKATTQKTADKAETHTSNEGQMFHNVSDGHYAPLPQFLPTTNMPQFSPKEGFTPRTLEPGEGKVNYTQQPQDFYPTVTHSAYDSGYEAFGKAKVPTENTSTPVAKASTEQAASKKRSRSLSQRLSRLFKREILCETPSKMSKTEVTQSTEPTVVQDESKKNLGKIKEQASEIGEIVKLALKDKKAELRKNGSVELEIQGMGKVTVLKTERRNLFQSGSLYVRFAEGAHLGSGAFKDVELGIKLKSFNRSIPVAIARAKVQSDKHVLKSEHETSQKMKSLFGDRIFASKRMINLRDGSEGFIMPLAHGNYESPKIMGDRNRIDVMARPGLQKLPKEKRVANAKVMLETLREMETAGYVHADFKGDNIFLDAEGNPQIADWGAAYSKKDFENKEELKARVAKLEQEAKVAEDAGESDKVKGLQTEISNLNSSFEALTKTAKLSWARLVFESFSAAEWDEVKDQIIDVFGDDPKLEWDVKGPVNPPKKPPPNKQPITTG